MNIRTKKVFILILVVAGSAMLTSFIILAITSGVRIQTAHAPFLNRIFSFFVNTSMTTSITPNSLNPVVPTPIPTPTPASTPAAVPSQPQKRQPPPPGFKGPTGPPHVNGPTSPPPDY